MPSAPPTASAATPTAPPPAGSVGTLDLLIVVVNFRTPDLTIQCLASLEPEIASLGRALVVVTDNASGDDSLARIGEAIRSRGWGSWCRLVPLAKNGGFAWGNNRGIEAGGSARFTLLLNSDTVVHPGALRYCVDLMDREPTIGVMSCKLLNADGSVQNVARRFPNPLRLIVSAAGLPWKLPSMFEWGDTEDRGWDRAAVARDVGWLGGAFLLIRGTLLDRIGGLDDDFFFYAEDIEFSHRVWRAGFRCYYDPAVSIVHLGGSSSDPARMARGVRALHHWRGRYLNQRKCYGRASEWLVRGVDIAANAARMWYHRLRHGRDSEGFRHHREVLRVITGSLDFRA